MESVVIVQGVVFLHSFVFVQGVVVEQGAVVLWNAVCTKVQTLLLHWQGQFHSLADLFSKLYFVCKVHCLHCFFSFNWFINITGLVATMTGQFCTRQFGIRTIWLSTIVGQDNFALR